MPPADSFNFISLRADALGNLDEIKNYGKYFDDSSAATGRRIHFHLSYEIFIMDPHFGRSRVACGLKRGNELVRAYPAVERAQRTRQRNLPSEKVGAHD